MWYRHMVQSRCLYQTCPTGTGKGQKVTCPSPILSHLIWRPPCPSPILSQTSLSQSHLSHPIRRPPCPSPTFPNMSHEVVLQGRANLLYRLPQYFGLRGRGSNPGISIEICQNSLSEAPTTGAVRKPKFWKCRHHASYTSTYLFDFRRAPLESALAYKQESGIRFWRHMFNAHAKHMTQWSDPIISKMWGFTSSVRLKSWPCLSP